MKIEKNDMVMVYDGGGTVPHCKPCIQGLLLRHARSGSRIQKRVRGGQVRKEMCGTGALVLSPRACGCRW